MAQEAPSLEEQVAGLQQQVGSMFESLGTMAQQQEIPYYKFRAEFSGIPRRKMVSRAIDKSVGGEAVSLAARGDFSMLTGPDVQKVPEGVKEDYVVAPSGRLLYANGVIADPETGDVFYKPGSVVAGSPAWRLKVQEEWSDKEANAWRKRLLKFGYIPQGGLAEKGGVSHDLLAALSMYHKARYTNYGRALPITAGQGEADASSIDKMALKQQIKTWGQVPFGEDLEDKETEWLSDRVIEVAQRLARKRGLTFGEALGKPSTDESGATGAFLRVEKQFAEQPQVAALLQEQEDQEVSYKIRDSLIGVSGLLGA